MGTCPRSCQFNGSGCGSSRIDPEYTAALADAVPRRGVAFTYSHFEPALWADYLGPKKTVINWSAPDPAAAAQCVRDGIAPATAVVPRDYWQSRRVARVDDMRLVRCPAEYRPDINCNNCGGGDPLCARPDRDYVVTFTAHGSGARLAESNARGGCYGDYGHVVIHWSATRVQLQPLTDAEELTQFVRKLPPRTILRHHVVGDLGKD